MRVDLHNGEIHVPRSLDKAIQNKTEKIRNRLKRYHPDVAELEIRLQHQDKTKDFECNLVLRAFKDTLYAKKSAPELRVAVDKSFEAILRELDSYRVRINKNLQPHA